MKLNYDDQKIDNSSRKDKIVKIFNILNIFLYVIYFYAFQKNYLYSCEDAFINSSKTFFNNKPNI